MHTRIYTILCTHTCFFFFKCTYMVPLFAISKKGGWEPDTPPRTYPGYPATRCVGLV